MADREAMRRALGLDDPTILQFLRFLRDALSGDLGVSYRFGVPVGRLLTERLPATLELSLCAMLVATLLGIPLGVWTALHRRRVSSHVLMLLSLVGVALPTFLIGIVLILIFSVWLGWLPSFGRGTTVALGRMDHRPAHRERPQGAGAAEPDARPVPDDADPAAGARRNARGAARRLHQVRARPRPAESRGELPPCAQEYARSGDHHHRTCNSATSSRSRSWSRPCSSGPASGSW